MTLLIIGFLVVWLICGILCAVVADSKHRSTGGWFCVGLTTGILGLLAIVGMPALEPQAAQPALEPQAAPGAGPPSGLVFVLGGLVLVIVIGLALTSGGW